MPIIAMKYSKNPSIDKEPIWFKINAKMRYIIKRATVIVPLILIVNPTSSEKVLYTFLKLTIGLKFIFSKYPH